jgi:thiamine biosynthesis protein ThiS
MPLRATVAVLNPNGGRGPPRVVTSGAGRYRPRVRVTVNDEPRALPDGATVADLIAVLELGPRRIAVEVNRAVVPRAAYPSTPLHDGDAVEVIQFVGGG